MPSVWELLKISEDPQTEINALGSVPGRQRRRGEEAPEGVASRGVEHRNLCVMKCQSTFDLNYELVIP